MYKKIIFLFLIGQVSYIDLQIASVLILYGFSVGAYLHTNPVFGTFASVTQLSVNEINDPH